MSDDGKSMLDGWLKAAEEALQKASDAVADAWGATEGSRRQAWETAKQAVDQASEALDQGIDVAKTTWDTTSGSGGDAASSAQPADTDTGAETAEPEDDTADEDGTKDAT